MRVIQYNKKEQSDGIANNEKQKRTAGRWSCCRLDGLPPSLLHILEEKTRAGCDAEYSPPRVLRFPLIVSDRAAAPAVVAVQIAPI